MGHNGHGIPHGINMYGIIMTLMGKIHVGGQSELGHLSLLPPITPVWTYIQVLDGPQIKDPPPPYF